MTAAGRRVILEGYGGDGQTDRRADGQADRQTDRQAGGQSSWSTTRQTDRQDRLAHRPLRRGEGAGRSISKLLANEGDRVWVKPTLYTRLAAGAAVEQLNTKLAGHNVDPEKPTHKSNPDSHNQ